MERKTSLDVAPVTVWTDRVSEPRPEQIECCCVVCTKAKKKTYSWGIVVGGLQCNMRPAAEARQDNVSLHRKEVYTRSNAFMRTFIIQASPITYKEKE